MQVSFCVQHIIWIQCYIIFFTQQIMINTEIKLSLLTTTTACSITRNIPLSAPNEKITWSTCKQHAYSFHEFFFILMKTVKIIQWFSNILP